MFLQRLGLSSKSQFELRSVVSVEQRHYNQLKEELAKMKPPSDLDSDAFKLAVQNGPTLGAAAATAAGSGSSAGSSPSTSGKQNHGPVANSTPVPSVPHKPPNGTSPSGPNANPSQLNMNMNHTDSFPDDGLLGKVNKVGLQDLLDSSPSDSSSSEGQDPLDNDATDNINAEILFL